MFRGSIFWNVANGLAGTEAMNLPENERRIKVEEACRAAYAHDFIEKLPQVRELLDASDVIDVLKFSEGI